MAAVGPTTSLYSLSAAGLRPSAAVPGGWNSRHLVVIHGGLEISGYSVVIASVVIKGSDQRGPDKRPRKRLLDIGDNSKVL